MKNLVLMFLIPICFCCKNIEKETTKNAKEAITEKLMFADTESQIIKFRSDSGKYWEIDDTENALKYSDSIKNVILNSYIGDYLFKTVDGNIYNTSKRTKPLFLQVTASWCAPCKFEIPALNKVAKKYSDKVDFVLLFWDTPLDLKKLAPDYNKNIYLVPSQKKQTEATTIDISGFRHIMGFPTDYLITKDNQIINFSQGAMIPNTRKDANGKEIIVTDEDANRINFERLDSEIRELLGNTVLE